ncbi:hypothetical protein EVAR_72675_1, partial [Eumeta japonica]
MDSIALWLEDENESVDRVTRRILRDRSDILSLNDRSLDLKVQKRSTRISNIIKLGTVLKLLGQGGYQPYWTRPSVRAIPTVDVSLFER